METYGDEVHVIEDFLDPATCKFLIDYLGKYAENDPKRPGFKIAADLNTQSAINLLEQQPLFPDYPDKDYQKSLDIVTQIIKDTTKIVSVFYGNQYILKTFCFTTMEEGSSNRLHADNKYVDENGIVKDRTDTTEDRSVLVYLNDDYYGGEIDFPKLGLALRPKAGSLIFFEGNEKTAHRVNEVMYGERHNLISFLWPIKYAGKIPEFIDGVETFEFK